MTGELIVLMPEVDYYFSNMGYLAQSTSALI